MNSTLRTEVEKQKHEIAELERASARIAVIEEQLEGMRPHIDRLKAQRDHFAEYGNKRIPIAGGRAEIPEIGRAYPVELEPRMSLHTGKQLAARVDEDLQRELEALDRLRDEAEALADPKRRSQALPPQGGPS